MTILTLNEAVLGFSVKVTEMLRERYKEQLVSVCLFGSAARGQLRKGSDMDFFAVMKEATKSYHKRVKDIMPVLTGVRETDEYRRLEEFGLDLEPSFLISTVEEVKQHPPILIEISQDGKILFDDRDFLKKELTEVVNVMKRLGSVKKKTAHGHYWVLKPDMKFGEVIAI